MLDTSMCQKPAARMNFRGIRSSKFRHVYGQPAKKASWNSDYDDDNCSRRRNVLREWRSAGVLTTPVFAPSTQSFWLLSLRCPFGWSLGYYYKDNHVDLHDQKGQYYQYGSDQVGGGGSFVVLPLERTGRVGQAAWKVNFLFIIVVTITVRSIISCKREKRWKKISLPHSDHAHERKDEKDADYIFASFQVSGHAGPVLDIR